MAEIVFDAFNPNEACLAVAPSKAADNCRIQASFHLRGEATPTDPFLSFKRTGDQFLLESQGSETLLGLVKGLGVSENSPQLQSKLLYSIALFRYWKDNYNVLLRHKRRPYQGRDFFPAIQKFSNFIVAGSVLNPDSDQAKQNELMLKEIFALQVQARKFIHDGAESLSKSKNNLTLTLPEMRPRIRWFADLLNVHAAKGPALSNLDADDPLHGDLKRWTERALIYLGTGQGDVKQLKEELDAYALRIFQKKNRFQYFEDIYQHFQNRFAPLLQSKSLQQDPLTAKRLKDLNNFLGQSIEERRAELNYLGRDPQLYREGLNRSLVLRLLKAGRQGDLAQAVAEEAKYASVPLDWFYKSEHMTTIAEAIVPAVQWKIVEGKVASAFLDWPLLIKNLDKLFATHSIRRRAYFLGALAAIRFLFGKDLNAGSISAWNRTRYENIPLDDPTHFQHLNKLAKNLERSIQRSTIRSERVLPWIEGALCVAGLGLGGTGFGIKQRELVVSGSTVSGLGCGALATHFIVRGKNRNHYLWDSLGGALGAGLGFSLAWTLYPRSSGMRPPEPPPPPPPPPPPQDPGQRNPVDRHGP